MPISAALLPEFDQEMANMRKTLARIPDAKLDWKPDPKSMSMGGLGTHIANMGEWAAITMNTESLDYTTAAQPPEVKTTAELLERFDKNMAGARAAIAAASDADLMKTWSLTAQGKALFTMPRIAVLRSMIMNHLIHHRGQLTVYFRLNGIPVPALYGPSADEN
jgi:uncharacterized damage-inducible protein DinB